MLIHNLVLPCAQFLLNIIQFKNCTRASIRYYDEVIFDECHKKTVPTPRNISKHYANPKFYSTKNSQKDLS